MKDPLTMTWLKHFGDVLSKYVLLLLDLPFYKYLNSLQGLGALQEGEEAMGRRAHEGEVVLPTLCSLACVLCAVEEDVHFMILH